MAQSMGVAFWVSGRGRSHKSCKLVTPRICCPGADAHGPPKSVARGAVASGGSSWDSSVQFAAFPQVRLILTLVPAGEFPFLVVCLPLCSRQASVSPLLAPVTSCTLTETLYYLLE